MQTCENSWLNKEKQGRSNLPKHYIVDERKKNEQKDLKKFVWKYMQKNGLIKFLFKRFRFTMVAFV